MKRWWGVLVLIAVALAAGTWARQADVGSPSIHSRGGPGLAAAWGWAQRRGGAEASMAPWSELPAGGTLIVALPGVRTPDTDAAAALRAWVTRGGHLALLLDAQAPPPPSLPEALRFSVSRLERAPPLDWDAWHAWMVDHEQATGPYPLRGAVPDQVLTCPPTAEVRHARPDGEAATCTWPLGEGRVTLVLDREVLSNARLRQADNLALLGELAAGPAPLRFDEWVHGAGAAGETTPLGPGPGALFAHLALLYALAVLPLARRIGAPARRLEGTPSSTERELRVLAALHARAGHAREAGARLLSLARARSGERAALPDRFVGGDAELLALARRVSQLEKGDADE